jgi:ribulose-bisphosphate carboxylase large chain
VSGSVLRTTYHAVTKAPEKLARAIAVEQTVEIPEALIDARTDREIVGKVEGIDPLPDGRFALTIAYPAGLVASLPDLLSVLYGNVSMLEVLRLADITLPPETLALFKGPNFGIQGLRDLLQVHDRPLLCTVLKPRGAADAHFAKIAEEFALAGGDLIKEDNNLLDAAPEASERRIAACASALARANRKTGRRCLYFVNACVPIDRLERLVAFAVKAGAAGVLVPPLLMGIDVVRDLAARHRIAVMAHPSFTGTFFEDRRHGIEPGILMGTILRLAGADIVIFVNHGGRFNYRKEECESMAEKLRAPLGNIRAAFPAPAGGMTLERVGEMVNEYGTDTVLVFGGAMLGGLGGVGKSVEACLAALETKRGQPRGRPR